MSSRRAAGNWGETGRGWEAKVWKQGGGASSNPWLSVACLRRAARVGDAACVPSPAPTVAIAIPCPDIFLALCEAVEQLGSGGWSHGTSAWLGMSFFASRQHLFKNPMMVSISRCKLNVLPPSPALDSHLGVARRGQGASHAVQAPAEVLRRGSQWHLGARTFPRPGQHPAGCRKNPSAGAPEPAPHPCPAGLCLWEEKQEVKAETWAHVGWLWGDEHHAVPPGFGSIAPLFPSTTSLGTARISRANPPNSYAHEH